LQPADRPGDGFTRAASTISRALYFFHANLPVSPRGFPAFRQTLIRSGIIISGVVCAAVLWMSFRQTDTSPIVWLITGPILLVVLVNGVRKAIAQQKEIWSSVEIRMDDGAVGRSQIRVPEILIRREEVTAVRETGQGMVVKTADRYRSLLIPRLLDPADYAEIREDLATWVPIESGGGERGKGLAFMGLLIAGFAVMGFSHNPGLVAAVAFGLIAIYVWSVWRVYRQKGMDPAFRKQAVFVLVFVILFAAARLAFLFGFLG
jgi:hypothetical protein